MMEHAITDTYGNVVAWRNPAKIKKILGRHATRHTFTEVYGEEAKAVANLAIRLALGQVLTNRVFSVFIADEVDAAMDDERAAYTAECLRRLTDLISQVILITHKHPEADQMLELDSNGCEQRAGAPYTVSTIGRGNAPRPESAAPPAS